MGRPWLAAVLALFCLPLFISLGQADLENDEAIYSFAVDRILESGDWLAPKLSPTEDSTFLEKPPLKFWIVAAPIKAGLLPLNEFGLRFWDVVFGAAAWKCQDRCPLSSVRTVNSVSVPISMPSANLCSQNTPARTAMFAPHIEIGWIGPSTHPTSTGRTRSSRRLNPRPMVTVSDRPTRPTAWTSAGAR